MAADQGARAAQSGLRAGNRALRRQPKRTRSRPRSCPRKLAVWWRRRSLRARLTLTASAVLAIALAAAAAVLVNALRVSLTRGLDDTARQGAAEVAALADANRLPNPVPVEGGTITVQVLNAQGRITDASPGADLLVPLLPAAQAARNARTHQAVLLRGEPYGLPSLLRVVAVSANDHQTVIAAVAFSQVNDSLATVARALFITMPLLLLLLAGTSWLLIGSTLRPIAELRRGAQAITASAMSRRLPVPEARDEAHSLAVTLNDMLARLEAAHQRQRGLVSDTAHELRSPIASIRAQLEVALDHPDAQDWRQTAGDVLADTLRLAKLAEDLLVLARLDEREGRLPARAAVDLTRLSHDAALRYAEARVPVTADGPECCAVSGDPDGLARVLVNLIDNAVRYARSQVTVAVRADGECALLTVTDDGPGIPPDYAERVFDRFTRLDDARSREGEDQGGAGLGLAIVRATAAAHEGAAWLEDAEPGLRAVIRLPAIISDGPTPPTT